MMCRAAGRTPAKTGRIVDGLSLALPVAIRLDPAERLATMETNGINYDHNDAPIYIPNNIPGRNKNGKFRWLHQQCCKYFDDRPFLLPIQCWFIDKRGKNPEETVLFRWDWMIQLVVSHARRELDKLVIPKTIKGSSYSSYCSYQQEIDVAVKVGLAVLKIGTKHREKVERVTASLMALNLSEHEFSRVAEGVITTTPQGVRDRCLDFRTHLCSALSATIELGLRIDHTPPDFKPNHYSVVLHKHERAILKYLSEQKEIVYQVDIEAGTELTKKTAGKYLPGLTTRGFVNHPKGKRGYSIIDKGRGSLS